MTESLNIEHHRRELILKALNKAKACSYAAKLLGISTRTLSRDIRRYGFKKEPGGGYYEKRRAA